MWTRTMIWVAVSASVTGQAKGEWRANSDHVKTSSQRRKDVLYEEERVPEYVLPDPLITSQGEKLKAAAAWRKKRRLEVLELFRQHVYGRAPLDRPQRMKFELFEEDGAALNGKATRKQVAVFLGGKSGIRVDLLLFLPSKAPGPVPLFLLLNFKGNHTVDPHPAIRLTESWTRENDDHRASAKDRGIRVSRFPVEAIVDRGYGLATAYYGDIDPDFHDQFENGVHGVFDSYKKNQRPKDAWGSISAWAWGLSRMMDYLEKDEAVDEDKVAVLGHSRLGKTSLWAGAQDERFAIVISNDSGCGGAALSRRRFGETVKRINSVFPHWFCDGFKEFNDKEEELPVDQHMLLSLVAPRPVYVASADLDLWADPRGEFLSALNADPVYKLLGTEGLPTTTMPGLNQPVQGGIGYHIRSGGHDLTEYDWQRFMDFADKHYGRD